MDLDWQDWIRLRDKKYLVKGLGFFFVFLLILFLETRRLFISADPRITVYLQTLIPRLFDVPLSVFSLLGSFEVTSLILLLLAAFYFFKTRRVPLSLVLFGVILAFEFLGKVFVYHPSPPSIFFRYSIPFIFPSGYVHTNYSFPSGHMSRTLFVLIVAAFLAVRYWAKSSKKMILLVLLAAFALMMAVSRIYLGEHWASDVLGGLFLGASLGTMSIAFF